MFFRPFPRQWLSGLLLLSLLLQVLLPAVAGTRADAGARWMEVCAASGIKWVKLDTTDAGASHAAGDHCMLCAATGAAPDFDARRYLRTDGAVPHPLLSVTGAIHTFPGHSLRSRAPPAHS